MVKTSGGIYKMNLIKTTVFENRIKDTEKFFYQIKRTLFGFKLKNDFEEMACISDQLRYECGEIEVEE